MTVIEPRKRILVYPGEETSPYLSLLYGGVSKRGCVVKYLNRLCGSRVLTLLNLPIRLAVLRVVYPIVHIHWLHEFHLAIHGAATINRLLRWLMQGYALFIIALIKALRYRLVWTIHNTMPHAQLFSNDLMVRRFLAKQADLKIVHSRQTLQELAKLHIDEKRTEVVPCGPFGGLYTDSISRGEARSQLGLGQEEIVFVHMGLQRPYKGTLELIEVFQELCRDNGNLKLFILGPCYEADYRKTLERFRDDTNIVMRLEYVPDDEVQVYMRAADIGVYPFRRVTTSASVLTAMAFDVPVVAPHTGSISNIPEACGYFYDIYQDPGLKASMIASLDRAGWEKRKENMRTFLATISWDVIADRTVEAYGRLFERNADQLAAPDEL